MDDAITTGVLDLTGMTLAELLDPPPGLRDVLDSAGERLVRQILDTDGECC